MHFDAGETCALREDTCHSRIRLLLAASAESRGKEEARAELDATVADERAAGTELPSIDAEVAGCAARPRTAASAASTAVL